MSKVVQIFVLLTVICSNINAQTYTLVINYISDENAYKLKPFENFQGDSLEITGKLYEILDNLHTNGFLAASIDSINYTQNNAIADLYVGNQYKWSEIDFSGLGPNIYTSLRLGKTNFDIVNLDEFNRIKTRILNYYENSGYPFVQVIHNQIEINDSTIKLKLEVNKGGFYSIDSVIVKGDAKITSNYIQKTIRLDKGEPFNQKKIIEVSNRINNIKFLEEIKPSEVEFGQNQVDLYMYLQNKKANMFNGIIGFLPENEETGKLLITGELNLNLANSFGRGEEIYLQWEKMESSTQKLDVGFAYPFIFRSNFGLDADFSLYKKDSSYLSTNTGVGIRLFLENTNYLRAYYRYKSSVQIGDEESRISSINFADVKSNILGASYYLNELDYVYNPRKGVVLDIFAGAGFKNISGFENLNDSLNLNTDNNTIEIEAGLGLGFYYPIYNNFVFHFGNTTRYLDQFGDDNKDVLFFENELYRFGGARSLRGFDESIFLASIYSLQNIEVKYLFEQNSAFYLFWNGAYYYKNLAQGVTEDFPWGFGIGLDFETQAGIFSLSYALGKQFDNPIEIRTAKIHFGYISRF